MTDRLAEMLHAQRALQEKINGYTLESQTTEQRIENIKENVLALTDELHEVLGEMSWKSWTSATFLNRDAAVGEAIDCWHFLMNIFLHLDVNADELFERYRAKRALNEKRQDDGYTGLEKCPSCKRALDEVKLTRHHENGAGKLVTCQCGAFVDAIIAAPYLID